MPCYHPIEGWRSRSVNASGKRSIVFKEPDGLGPPVSLPCGRCIGCKLEHSRQWAVRCMHEASMHRANCFLTLTYDDGHVPAYGTLVKSHFQDFMKRLRYHAGVPIRYYMCGEYGELYRRPHYHACLFGYNFPDLVLHSISNGEKLYSSGLAQDIWGHGFCLVGELTFDSAAYVARYVVSKLTGDAAEKYLRCDEFGEVFHVEPEFALMSRRPGIGRAWFDRYSSEVYPVDSVVSRGVEMKPPRYYDKLLERTNPEVYETVRADRLRQALASPDNTGDVFELNPDGLLWSVPGRLTVRETVRQGKIDFLKRSLDDET